MLFGMLAGSLSILATHVVVGAAFIGLGLLVRRAFGLGRPSIRDLLVAFWIGLAAVMLFLTGWTFFFRVNAVPLLAVLAAGLGGLARSAGEFRVLASRESSIRSRWIAVPLVLAALWIANLGRGPITNTDSALYHIQGVLWAGAYPTVPGLVNLFGPLGFNNASFLFDALLDVGPWDGRAHHVANSLLIQALLAQGLLGIARVWRAAGAERIQGLFEGVLVAPAVNMSVQDWLPSFATDLPAAAVLLVAAAEAHLLLLRRGETPREDGYRAATVLILLTVAVTYKVNSAVFAAGTAVLVGWWWARRAAREDPGRLGVLVGAGGAMAAIGGSWVARGVVLSGYLLFPTASLSVPVEWRAPAEHAQAEFAYAAESSRATVESYEALVGDTPRWSWIGTWWQQSAGYDVHHLIVPALLAAVATLGYLAIRRYRRQPPEPGGATWWLAGVAVTALVPWFLVAPEPRYAAPLVWTTAGVAAAACLGALGTDDRRASRAAVWAAILVGLSPCLIRPLVSPQDPELPPLRRLLKINFRLPGPAAWLHPTGGRSRIRTYVTRSGLELNVTDRRCWAAPLPCTPNPAPNLRLRVPGRIEKGFVVDGPWRMENWPAGRAIFHEAWVERRRRAGPPAGGR